MSRKRRSLSPEENQLWEKVKKTAKPLAPNVRSSLADKQALERELSKPSPPKESNTAPEIKPQRITLRPTGKQSSGAGYPGAVFKPAKPVAPNPLERNTSRKIASGRISIDRKLDLHGMTQNEAYHRLMVTLEDAWLAEKRTVLVVTGKGKGEGILRQAVPRWLAEAGFRQYVSGVSEAHVSHGGSGALYVRLKRRKPAGR